MFFKFCKQIFLIFLVLCSCTNREISSASGVDDFVLASYKIDEGKAEILKIQGEEVGSLKDEYFKEKKDLIVNGDILNIEIFHPIRSDLVSFFKGVSDKNGFKVKEGKIFIPNLGYLKVLNLSLKEVKEKIFNELSEIDNLQVFVSFKTRKKKKVEVVGLVSQEVEITNKTRLFDVLLKLKIPKDVSFFKSYYLRGENFLTVDFAKLIKSGDMSQNILVEDKDKIYLAEKADSRVYVLGEVLKPGYVDASDGKVSIKDVIATAGGLSLSADRAFIQVFRTNVKEPKIYVLDIKTIYELPNRCLNLIEGDIVYVSTNLITDWNRFITQVLPSISLIDSAHRGFKNLGIILNGS